jgi:hypothetical protein
MDTLKTNQSLITRDPPKPGLTFRANHLQFILTLSWHHAEEERSAKRSIELSVEHQQHEEQVFMSDEAIWPLFAGKSRLVDLSTAIIPLCCPMV